MWILNPGTWKRFTKGRYRFKPFPVWSAGFTLIEMLVTLFIITLLVGLVVPRLGLDDLDSVRMKAMRFRNVLRWLQDQATYTGGHYRLHMDFTEQRYWCEILNGTTYFPVEDPLLRSGSLQTDQIRMVWVPYNSGITDADEVLLPFTPVGPEQPVMVQFVGLDGLGYSVSLRPEWWTPRLQEGLLQWHMFEEVNQQ